MFIYTYKDLKHLASYSLNYFNLSELCDKVGWSDYVIKTNMAAKKRSIWEWIIQHTFSFLVKLYRND